MKTLLSKVSSHPQYARVIEWGKLIAVTGSTQVLVQIIGFACGILIVRTLSTEQYALYTLANTMLGTMIVLADSGIASGVMSQGGKVWTDRNKLGDVVATGLFLRKRFAIGSLLVAVPILLYLLQHHGASISMSILIVLALIPSYFAALSGELLEIAPKLSQDVFPLQRINVEVNLGRVLFVGMFYFLFPWAAIMILANGLPQIWGNFRLRRRLGKYIHLNINYDPAIRSEILTVVKRMLPGMIYYCLSGQITIWLISLFGSTKSLAQLGALGRLGMLPNFIFTLFAILLVPRFARLPMDVKKLLGTYVKMKFILFIICTGLVLFVWFFRMPILALLGNKYISLSIEMLLVLVGSCINIIASSSFSLCASKGWVVHPVVSISINIFSIIVGIFFLDVSTLNGILYLNIIIALVQLIMNMSFAFIKIINPI